MSLNIRGQCYVAWGNGIRNKRVSGHIERMENEKLVKKVYHSSVEGPNRRGRPRGWWEDKVKKYMSERGARGNGLE